MAFAGRLTGGDKAGNHCQQQGNRTDSFVFLVHRTLLESLYFL
jgi:hypothetical protein